MVVCPKPGVRVIANNASCSSGFIAKVYGKHADFTMLLIQKAVYHMI